MKCGKRVLMATYNMNSETTTTHGKRIEKGEGRFFITKVLKDARVWKVFNIDKLCAGSLISWKLLDVSVLQKITIPLRVNLPNCCTNQEGEMEGIRMAD